jgi:hypothetical protein
MMVMPPPAALHAPAIVQVQAVAPAAGAPGQALSATANQRSTEKPVASLNGGNLPSAAVPGGVHHAPNRGHKAGSFSKPIHRD